MADGKPNELVFVVPAKDFKHKHGCSMDFGGSVIKMAYSLPEAERISIHCLSFPTNNLKGALHYLKSHAPRALEPGSTIDVCGVGCHRHKELIKKILGVEVTIQNELDGFVGAFRYLREVLPKEKLVYPESKTVSDHVNKQLEDIQKSFTDVEKLDTDMQAWSVSDEKEAGNDVTINAVHGTNQNGVDADPCENEADEEEAGLDYPALLAMCGSGGCPIVVNEDGSYRPVDGFLLCGRFFLGMGSLLTGEQEFDQLSSLAEDGDRTKLDVMGKALKDEEAGDFYSTIIDDFPIYGMGHAVRKHLRDFRREDLAAALVANVAFSVAQTTHLWAMLQDVKTVYFCGSLVSSSQMFRDAMSKELGIREKVNVLGKQTDHYFLQCGAYLGCIGCMMMTLKQEHLMHTSK